VLSANQCIKESNLPSWVTGNRSEGVHDKLTTNGAPTPARLRRKSTITDDGHEIALPEAKGSISVIEEVPEQSKSDEYASRGGSCIISPMGEVLAGPLWDDDNGLLTFDVDFDDCLRGRLDLDVGGSYSRYGCENLI
jgi:nitrilase